MNELMCFEGSSVSVIQIDGEPMFELYSTGAALGYVVRGKSGKFYPNKARIDKVCENAEISACLHGVNTYLTESQLYDFMLEARTDKCRAFRKWVTNDVLPAIRKDGIYVAPEVKEQKKHHHHKQISQSNCIDIQRNRICFRHSVLFCTRLHNQTRQTRH